MDGIQLDYELRKNMGSMFNQKMFGRLSIKATPKASYVPGVLDDIPYHRIFRGRIFISTTSEVDFDPIMQYCKKFEVTNTRKGNDNIFMKTGRERWKIHAEERGLEIVTKNR